MTAPPSSAPPPPSPGDRRRGDRRRRPTPPLSRYTFLGRRRGFRRVPEARNAYVDLFSARSVFAVCAILLLSALDAAFTLIHVRRGAFEMNPLMRHALDLGPTWFVSSKMVLGALGLVVLLLHKNFTGVRSCILLFFGIYSLLIVYHVVLFLVSV